MNKERLGNKMTLAKNNVNNETDNLDQILALQDMDVESLRTKASELGVEIKQDMDQSDIIDAVVAKMGDEDSEVETQAEHGQLFSLHTRDDDAKNIIVRARNRILANREANVYFTLYLKNRDQDSYTRRVPGVRLTTKNVGKILDLVSLLPDGSQEEILNQFKTSPDSFKDPLLVHMRRRNHDGSFGNYVMLFLQRKSQNLVEVTF